MVMRQHRDGDHETPKVTMTMQELAAQIRRHGIWAISEMFMNSAARVMMGLRDGVNIYGWEMDYGPGVIRFALRRDVQSGRPEQMVIYLNTDNPEIIANWRRELPDQVRCPHIMVTRAEGKIEQERDPGFLAAAKLFRASEAVRQ
jgi:hypothetical protein